MLPGSSAEDMENRRTPSAMGLTDRPDTIRTMSRTPTLDKGDKESEKEKLL